MAKLKHKQYDVFISYRRAFGGWAYARLIAEVLKNAGFNVFIDVDVLNQDAFGNDFEEVISEAIKRSKVVIFILVDHALDRCVSDKGHDVLEKEILLACRLKKKLIPIINHDFTVPKGLNPIMGEMFRNKGIIMNDSNWKNVSNGIIKVVSELTGKKPIEERPNKYLGILKVNQHMNYIIDYSISEFEKDIQEREIEVYKRNAKKIFNSNRNDIDLKVVPLKENKKSK